MAQKNTVQRVDVSVVDMRILFYQDMRLFGAAPKKATQDIEYTIGNVRYLVRWMRHMNGSISRRVWSKTTRQRKYRPVCFHSYMA